MIFAAKNGGGNGYGDPHFETLDHKSFQFDGHCSYILLRECKKPLHTPRFTIINKHGLMESLKGKLKAYVSKISVVIQLSSKKQFRTELLESKYVLINNGSVIDIADLGLWEDPTNGITIQPDHSKVKLDMAGEFTVWFNGNGRVDVAIDEKYHGKVCGLLGNANGDPDDDFHKLTSNGLELVSDVNEFANSWVVPGSCGNHITDCTELVQNRNPSSPPSLCCFQSISSSMWAFILYITLSLCTSHVMSNKLGNQWVSSLSLRDENDGKTCHDGEGHAGVCRDDRIDDNSGCYTHSKICWAHNNCNRHLMCFIPYMPGDLDGPCRSSGFGAHCVAREEQCFGVIHKNLCPCDYGCCHPFVDLICPNPNVCQLASATCPGIFYDTDVCGVGNGCCYNSIDDSQCTSIPVLGGVSGTCQYDNTLCDGWYVSNECGGHPNRRCCKPKTPDADAPYTNYPGAQCLDMTKEPCPNGDYRSGLCDPAGPRERQCCIPGCVDNKKNPTTGAIEPSPCHLAGGCCRPLRCENKEIEINEHCFQNEATSGLPTCKCCRRKFGTF
ncbi:uncharacterized protein LOC102802952 [Saccoglossus kowalevskii]